MLFLASGEIAQDATFPPLLLASSMCLAPLLRDAWRYFPGLSSHSLHSISCDI